MRSAPSHFLTRKSEKDDFMPRKYYFPGQNLINPGVLLFVRFIALYLSCSEIDHVKSVMTTVKSAVPSGAVSAVSSSALSIQF